MTTACGLNMWGLLIVANTEKGNSICAGNI